MAPLYWGQKSYSWESTLRKVKSRATGKKAGPDTHGAAQKSALNLGHVTAVFD